MSRLIATLSVTPSERSGDDEGCKKDPNFVGILLGSSADSEPLCEMANEWTPTPQPLVVDTGAAETVIPNTWWQVTFQVANVNKALGSVSKTVRNGHRVVFRQDRTSRTEEQGLWDREGLHATDEDERG